MKEEGVIFVRILLRISRSPSLMDHSYLFMYL